MSNDQESPEFTRMVVALMINAGITGASDIALAEAGIDDPEAYVAQLQRIGVVIKVEKRPAIVYDVGIWGNISHYICTHINL